MIKWSTFKSKHNPNFHLHSVVLASDVMSWLSYNKAAMDWNDLEWPAHLRKLEKDDD